MPDGTRVDVMLIAPDEKPVIVECKQHAPTVGDVGQLLGYMRHIQAETKQRPRGVLVHGGASKLAAAVAAAASKAGIEIVGYTLDVSFRPSTVA